MTAKGLRVAAVVGVAWLTAGFAQAQPPGNPRVVLPVLRQRGADLAPSPTAPPAERQPPRFLDESSAVQTRERLRIIFRQYPPSLSEVFRLDPSLLGDQKYLAPYPALAAFLTDHPEIARNPAFFVGENWQNWDRNTPAAHRIQVVQQLFGGLAFFLGFLTLVFVAGWVLRTLVDYRRWLRLTRVQTEVHTKLLDRFSNNEDLLAYVQTPAGRRFLESAPVPLDAGPQAIAAPIGRILWSAQAGTVATLVGVGLLYVSARMAADTTGFNDLSPFLFLVGTVTLAVGFGFLLSAVVSYFVSKRLGLLEPPAPSNA
jgi:hypothetical protein